MGCLTSPENRKSPLPEFILTGVKSLKVDLLDNLFSCHSIMCRTVLLPARITRVRRKVPDLVGNLSRTCRHGPGQ